MSLHTERVVVLVDMDCFYCQVEERLNPELIGKPIAVVQYNAWRGGGIIAVNYPARDRGVTRYMRGNEAKEKCPEIELVRVPNIRGKADLNKYREAGKRVAEVLQIFTPLLQRASVDEAYLDITEEVNNKISTMTSNLTLDMLPNTHVVGSNTKDFVYNVYNNLGDDSNLKLAVGGAIVEEIRAAVYEKTGYRCSAGIAHNKILAKLACGMYKPNKQTILPQDGVEELYNNLPLRKINSLGGKFGNMLSEELNITNMAELLKFSEQELGKRYDEKTASWLYNIARGIDNEPVEVRLVSKSIGCSKKFPGKTALKTTEDVMHWLSELASEIVERLEQDVEENNRRAKQIVISFAQEINRKDVHGTRTQNLSSYEAKRIVTESFEILKKLTQKADGSFKLKFLGLSAGKFEDCKNNVRDISLFFKPVEKSMQTDNSTNDRRPSTKKKDITSFFQTSSTNKITNSDVTKVDKVNKSSNFDESLSKESNNYDEKENIDTNKNNKKFKFRKHLNNIKLEYKSVDNSIVVNQNEEPIEKINNKRVEDDDFLHLSQIEEDTEVDMDESIRDIEALHRSICEDPYLNTTIEMDYSEKLKNKTEFPNVTLTPNKISNFLGVSAERINHFAENTNSPDCKLVKTENTKSFFLNYSSEKKNVFNENTNSNFSDCSSEKTSPIMNRTDLGDTSKSFFMRYAKKIDHAKKSLINQISAEHLENNQNQCKTTLDNEKPGCSYQCDSSSTNIVPTIYDSDTNDNWNDRESTKDNISTENSKKNNKILHDITSENTNSNSAWSANLKLCSECDETVPESDYITHMDHHIALKLMAEEKQLFQEHLKLEKQKNVPKVATPAPVKSTKTKATKRKSSAIENNNNTCSIVAYLTKDNGRENLENGETMQQCTECGRHIVKSELNCHLDFHAAKKLHLELNPVKSEKKTVNKSENAVKSRKKHVNGGVNTISSFFKPVAN